ncbi:hypothetical protein [Bradyrhizobium sp. NAS80.1]|uniref:hypothetical protein n=1 Tax=Bradyrhizobium sp. NAS80.1 TaxID=1680159 RepID=UPI000A01C8B5|nr:hypothetical protein [Bradyrhizobium sp. NAS80.1]
MVVVHNPEIPEIEHVPVGQSKAKAGTVDAVTIAFYKSDAFKKALANDTQDTWGPILDRFCEHCTR